MKRILAPVAAKVFVLIFCLGITAANEAPAHGAPVHAGGATTLATKGSSGNATMSHTTNTTGAGLGCSEYLWQSFVGALPGPKAHGSTNGSAKTNTTKTETTVVNTTKIETKSQDASVNKTEMHAVTSSSVHTEGASGTTKASHGDEHGATTKRSDAHGGIQEAFGNNPEKTAAGSATSNWTAPTFNFKISNCSDKTDKWVLDMKMLANVTAEHNLTTAAVQNYFTATLMNFNKAFTATFNTSSKGLQDAMNSANQWFKTAATTTGAAHSATSGGNSTEKHETTKAGAGQTAEAPHH